MVSRTRSVSSRSKSARSGSATSTTPRVGTTYGVHGEVLSKPPQGPKHTSHRAPKKTRKHKHLVLKWVLGIFAALIAAGIGLFAYMYITTEIPQPEKFALAEKTTVYYNDGTTPIGSYAEQNREIISCADLPDYVGNAIVASEDRSFYTNKGIDPIGIARAFYNNLTTGSRQGGSTITQQYAERYYLGETTSYVGKLREAFLAVKIAQAQDKSQVLCNYMNTIYLGRGAYGIQAAAKAYFGKDAKDLTLSEAAMLAGIIPAPSVWTPDVNPKQAEKRYKRVLNIMDEDGYITPDEKKAAKFPQTIEIQQNNQMSGPNGYLLTMVQNELVNTKAFSKQDLETGGYKIVTTIDKSKQDLMFSTISPSQNGMQGIVPDGMQFGALSVNPKDGSIISLYAGDDYLTKQLNNVTQATYEVGSTMKPFALLAAVNEGVSLNTYFNGNSYRTFPGITETVSNYGGENLGYVNLYTATEQSSNTVYMDLQTKLGAQKIAETARQAGVDDSSLDGSNPFTVLGNNGLTLKGMTQGYATLANQGDAAYRCPSADGERHRPVQRADLGGADVRSEQRESRDEGAYRRGPARHRHRGACHWAHHCRQVRHRKRFQRSELHRLHAVHADFCGDVVSGRQRQPAGDSRIRQLDRRQRLPRASLHRIHEAGTGRYAERNVPRRHR